MSKYLTSAGVSKLKQEMLSYIENLPNKLTRKIYLNAFKALEKFIEKTYQEPFEPDKIILDDVLDFHKHLVKTRSPSTVDTYFTVLRKLYRQFLPEKAEYFRQKAVRQKLAPKALTLQEQRRLLREAEKAKLRSKVIIYTLLYTGMRINELAELTWQDVDLKAKTITVKYGKHNRSRVIPINQKLLEVLKQYREETKGQEHFLMSNFKRPMSTDQIRRVVEELGRRAKVELTPHTLRHTFATNLINAGVPLTNVAILLGHTKQDGMPNLNVVARYTLPDMNRLTEDIEKI
ncbi:tyrosine-type recombinase/integrase [Carboxydothermus ferrireducens]|uniref:Integrase/recombinase XerC n=1 Tax=Carboxydothermus ferrireducens DSM 11255 TaxID=1119529 RepID=A0ABX2R7G1_9THEO|nr:site-specific integrase [Carboxydothermus ferrireducens]NYE57108.1 integrase/recombinase XerC [Carboxydothermus ferrireducens DSM 11255]